MKFHQFMDALSLSGSVVVLLVGLTVYGMAIHNDEAWKMFGTALTTFISGNATAKYELSKKNTADKEE